MNASSGTQEAFAQEPDRVKVTAADCNFRWDTPNPFDSPPFEPLTQWLVDAEIKREIRVHPKGGTDYARWDVDTPNGTVLAEPGDEVRRNRYTGVLSVWAMQEKKPSTPRPA